MTHQTSEPPWRPLSERVAGLNGERELVEGVPDYLRPHLALWSSRSMTGFPDTARAVELLIHQNLNLNPQTFDMTQANEVVLLDAVDAALRVNRIMTGALDPTVDERTAEKRKLWLLHVRDLQNILRSAGSAWQVKQDYDGLERRVDDTVVEATIATENAAPSDASGHLRRAWNAAFGYQPNPALAYSEAVKAVEAVAIPLTIPTDPQPTLGKVRAHLELVPHKYILGIADKHGSPASAESVTKLIALLWHGQRDRHAGGPTTSPINQETAQAAVHVAVLLVQFFSTGVIKKL
ncbi:hypothetical protein [Nonomuraea guangzhouensis]|uniref:Abortive infection protein-like C-terminal domain-containing protein n=1 Tax=Nonomuraea guangzhouensis TaxID=1291555 RepID=A0ABW4GWZ4_9ACTN|nr:hypothetical protein [Nonomuraea guangzhouensis]